VECWRAYADECESERSILPLRRHLIELRFPIRDGMSQDPSYLAATRLGREPFDQTGLFFRDPGHCRIIIYNTVAGSIPLLVADTREDFVSLVQAITRHNEPTPMPISKGACMVSGYHNWERWRALSIATRDDGITPRRLLTNTRGDEKQAKPSRELYQDRFILMSSLEYSGLAADAMQVDSARWILMSNIIRREHECFHYFTRRVFGSVKYSLLDEILGDYFGIVAAQTYFEEAWSARFLGLDQAEVPATARLWNYRGVPPLSRGAMHVLAECGRRAIRNLGVLHKAHGYMIDQVGLRSAFMVALTSLTLEELASPTASAIFTQALYNVSTDISPLVEEL
jgi:hypothetical protein